MTKLLLDPAIDTGAKGVISRQLAEAGAKRTTLQTLLERLADRANDNTERLAQDIERALGAARERFENVATPAQMNRLIEDLVGPSLVLAGGQLVAMPKTETATEASVAGVPGLVVCTEQ